MRAVAYRLRRLIRARWVATVTLSVIVALLAAIAISCAAGARRTATAPDRYVAAFGGGFDVEVTQDEGPPRTAEIAALPAVADVQATTFIFAHVAKSGTTDFLNTLAFSGSAEPLGLPLSSGRAPDPGTRNEFVASRQLVEANGLSIGDTFDVVTLTEEQRATEGFDATTFDGPSWTATLVGILDSRGSLDDATAVVEFSGTVLDDPAIAYASSVMWVAAKPGFDSDALQSQISSLPNGQGFKVDADVLVSHDVRTAVQAQGRGLWLLAAVTAIAAIAVLGQLITRQVRLSAVDRQRLSALGFTDTQIVAESVGRAALPIVIGSLLGAALAIAPSGLFPTGFVKVLEPDPGVDADIALLLDGAALFIVALTAWTVVALWLTARSARAALPSPTVDAIAVRAPSATAAMGLRFAFSRRSNDRGSVKGAMMGLILTVGALVGALTFGISLNRLVDQPARYGVNYDITTDDGSEVLPPEALDTVQTNPDISAAMAYTKAQARAGTESVDLVGMQPVRGGLRPVMSEGRLPEASDEIALGRITSNRTGAVVGDDITLDVGSTTQIFHVTGIAVVPGLAGGDGIGHGGVVTMSGLQRLEPDAQATAVMLTVDSSRPGALERVSGAIGIPADEDNIDLPSAISNLERVQAIPFVLAGVLALLLLLTIAHVMLTSLRNGRRDVAVLRSLGADTGWITRSMHWQVTTFAIVPIVLGAAVGVVAGRLVFQALADSIGALNAAAIPVALIAAVAVAALVLSNVTAAIPAGRARRMATATVLQSE
ncbi:MAG: hypothetical protein JWN99_1883 [Ilumatobacteraceae bacterium]|nr:hypothetical protein [Ilumatobacteraceae bacterium]